MHSSGTVCLINLYMHYKIIIKILNTFKNTFLKYIQSSKLKNVLNIHKLKFFRFN